MVLLSKLLRRDVSDGSGRSTRVVDFAVDLAAGDYPPVTEVLVPGEDVPVCALPWPTAAAETGEIVVGALSDARAVDDAELAEMVLLRRDVLDALVLDLSGLRAVRANDLWLRESDGQLVLAGADVSPWAVLRRLSWGVLGRGAERRLLDWKHVEFLRGDPHAAAAGRNYHRVITTLDAVQIARLTDSLPYLHAAELLLLLPDGLAADVLEHMLPERQVQVIAELEPAQAARVLAETAADAAADLLGRLEVADATRLLEALPSERSLAVQDLLRFPPDTAGGIMTNEVVTAPLELTVAGVLEHIRGQLARPDFVYFIYIVDDAASCRLRGVVTLRDLNLAEAEKPIAELMKSNLQTVGPLEPAIEVAHRIADYGLNAIPVVDTDQRLLGIVTVDKALAHIMPEAWRDRLPRIFS